MTIELNEDVREFLWKYPLFTQAQAAANKALANLYGRIQVQTPSQPWFKETFRTRLTEQCLQIYKSEWHPSVTPHCPWMHMETAYDAPRQSVSCRFDLEGGGATRQEIYQMSNVLAMLLRRDAPAMMDEQNWELRLPAPNPRQVILLQKWKALEAPEQLATQWITETAFGLLAELVAVAPIVDRAIKEFLVPEEAS